MAVSIRGYTALITGASRGIGRAICLQLAREGCNIFAVARSEEALKELVKECEALNVSASYYVADVKVKQEIEAAVSACLAKFSSIQILVNNAGVACTTYEPLDMWESAIETNLTSAVRFTKLLLPTLQKEAESGRNVSIVNIGSVSGIQKFAPLVPYCTSKHGLVGFSGSLFEAVRNKGIKVSVINPGWVDTDMTARIGLSAKEMLLPDDVARTVLFVVTFPGTGCPVEIQLQPQYNGKK